MRRSVIGSIALIVACIPSPSAVGQGLSGTCTATQTARQILRDEAGMEMYVEPVAFSESNGITLLAGTPNYIYSGSRVAPMGVVRDSIFGMVIGSSGLARTVASPINGLPTSIRVLPRMGGGWQVVFAEYPSGYQFPAKEQLSALWYGVLDGTRWTALEKIPLPSGARLSSLNASSLLSSGDTVSWALTYESDAGEGVALFQRQSGTWSVELLPVPNVAFVSLAHSRRDGLVLLPVRGDTAPDRANVPHLYARTPVWHAARQIPSGGDEPVFDVQVTPTASGDALTWWSAVQHDSGTRREARASLSAIEKSDGAVLILDHDVARVMPVQMRNGVPLWVVQGPRPQTNQMELRFIASEPNGTRQIARLDDPFDGPFSVFEFAPSTLLMAGPLLRRDSAAPTLVTLMLRIAITCKAP